MKKQSHGFTLVELVVVVMILGILAAVAAPRLLDTSETATENGAKQTLAVVRDAIERFAAQNEGQKPTSSIATELEDYLRGPFPACPVGDNAGDANVSIVTSGSAVTDETTNGWVYSTDTGEFIVNSDDTDSTGTATYDTY